MSLSCLTEILHEKGLFIGKQTRTPCLINGYYSSEQTFGVQPYHQTYYTSLIQRHESGTARPF